MSTKFFTGEGDKGESGFGGKKISKSSEYAEAVGALDEVTSWFGYCRAVIDDKFTSQVLRGIQETLFIAQAEVGSLGAGYPSENTIPDKKIKALEVIMEKIDREIPPLKHFIIPGGSRESAILDFGRALARRAERKIVDFSEKETKVSDNLLRFVNRLSSVLFALARYTNYLKGVKEEHPSYE